MTTTAIKEKVLSLEAQLESIKRLIVRKPDFSADEKIWKELKSATKRARKDLYRSRYGKK